MKSFHTYYVIPVITLFVHYIMCCYCHTIEVVASHSDLYM